ncbi:MAG TPA: tetratricopeptide repeat protein [bacterium]
MESAANSIDEELKKIKDFVNSDILTVKGLFLNSYRLIKTQGMTLIEFQIVLQCINLVLFVIGRSLQLKWLFFLYTIPNIFIGAILFLMPIIALAQIYEHGDFNIKDTLLFSYKKSLKYIVTFLLPVILLGLIFGIAAMILGLPIGLLGLPVGFAFLIIVLLAIAVFLWLIVPLFLLPYLLVCSDYYGLKAIRIANRITSRYGSYLFYYYMIISFLIIVVGIPSAVLLSKNYFTGYILSIPVSIIGLYGWAYGLLIYKHIVNKVSEQNLALLAGNVLQGRLFELDKTEPKDSLFYDTRGYLFLEFKEYDNAIAEFNHALALDENSKDSYIGLALSHFILGQKDKAKEYYRKAIILDPRYKSKIKINELKNEGFSYTKKHLNIMHLILADIHIEIKDKTIQIHCPFCGKQTQSSNNKCPHCNKDINIKNKDSKYTCNVCGEFANEDAQYCWYCGERFEDA